MTDKRLRDDFQENGFAVIPGFFSKALVKRWRGVAEKLFYEARLALTHDIKRPPGCLEAYSYVVSPSFVLVQPFDSIELVNNQMLGGTSRVGKLASVLLSNDEPYVPRYEVSFNVPGRRRQHVHRDFSPIFPKMKEPLPTTALCVTVPLVDTDEANGTLELWPGTHRLIDGDLKFMDRLHDRVKGSQGVRPHFEAGSLFLRDTRLIHRGVPNPGREIRPWLVSLWIHPLILFPNKVVVTHRVWDRLDRRARRRLRYADLAIKGFKDEKPRRAPL